MAHKRNITRSPHLYSVIALSSKTHTTANINAHVCFKLMWSATTNVTVMLNKK